VNSAAGKTPVWSVTQVNHAIRDLIEESIGSFWMVGEISGLLIHRSGHVYMNLKDGESQIRVCHFGGAAACRRMGLADGMRIEVLGKLTVYTVRGEYNFNVKEIRPAGLGDLQRRFEELKKKLADEGLFDKERKRPIPLLPERIGVISSPTGAALQDFMQILDRRFNRSHLRIVPCKVQGAGAEKELVRALEFLNRTRAVDVIVITRGGGSIEDLWAFNDETLARSVAASRIPVISAVGHEIDFTICDFAADLRAPTPSAAAELVITGADELTRILDNTVKRLTTVPQLAISQLRRRLERLTGSYIFTRPASLLEDPTRQLDEMEIQLEQAVKTAVGDRKQQLELLSAALHTLDPQRQLERGYAMVIDPENKQLVTVRDGLAAGKKLTIRFADGMTGVRVEENL